MKTQNSTQIRVGGVEDALALAELAARTFSQAFAADNRPEDLAAHIASSFGTRQQTAELADPSVTTLLAQQDHGLIGFAQVRRNAAPPCVTQTGAIELHRFYLDRACHGTGVAQVLMAAAKQAAANFGGAFIWLSVWENNPRAIAFYTKMGFKDQGSKDFFVGPDRQTDRVLVAPLSISTVDS
jgi:diamine N-acetyltransferase